MMVQAQRRERKEMRKTDGAARGQRIERCEDRERLSVARKDREV